MALTPDSRRVFRAQGNRSTRAIPDPRRASARRSSSGSDPPDAKPRWRAEMKPELLRFKDSAGRSRPRLHRGNHQSDSRAFMFGVDRRFIAIGDESRAEKDRSLETF